MTRTRLGAFLLICSFLGSCGLSFSPKPEKKPPVGVSPVPHDEEQPSDLERLHVKVELYESLQSVDEHGWILTDKCDALIFTGLYGAGLSEGRVNIVAARVLRDNGVVHWYRSPSKTCGPGAGSHSTISRDQILGLMWYMWKHKRLDLASELMADLKQNNYQLRGEGSIGELLMTPAMLNTLAWMIQKLGGPVSLYEKEILLPFTITIGQSFVSHLAGWHLALRGDMFGGLNAYEKSKVEELYRKASTNPFYSALYYRYFDGDYTEPVRLLLDEAHWPADRLPTNAEHCAEWPIERDSDSAHWTACEPPKAHSGAEIIAIYHLLIKPD